MSSDKPVDPRLLQALKDAKALEKHQRFNRMLFYKPYAKQKKFLDLGLTKRERMFMAGNRVGKTETGAFEAACHLTGNYPDWWQGKKFTHPTKGWCAGITSLDVRNVIQTKLCGQYGVTAAFGTGMIPKAAFADKPTLARGVTDAFDTIQVKHKTDGVEDGISIAAFKSYEQGREKFQGEGLDWGWCDEMPSEMDVYSEFLTRITGNGVMSITATPLIGTLNDRFLVERSEDRAFIQMTLDEAEHFTDEEKRKMIEGWPAYERETRRRGTPMAGFGRVFPYDEETLKEPYLEYVPPQWTKLWGIDFGIAHPFAAVLTAWDKDNDVIHVLEAFRVPDQQPLQHAVRMKLRGAAVPVAWPQDGTAREKGSGEPLSSLYKAQGLRMLPTHATHLDGSISTEAGYAEMDQRMTTGRLKVAAHLSDWFEEFRNLHRDKNSLIVKVRDDIMSATRTAITDRRHAQAVALGSQPLRRRGQGIAEGVDFDMD